MFSRPLGLDITVALALKLALLALLYLLFFRPDATIKIDAEVAARHLFLDPASVSPPPKAPQ